MRKACRLRKAKAAKGESKCVSLSNTSSFSTIFGCLQEILYARGYGLTSIEESGVSVSPRTPFRIGSVTKPLVGTAVMRLVENGQLDLDQPLNTNIKWLRFSEPRAQERITLRSS